MRADTRMKMLEMLQANYDHLRDDAVEKRAELQDTIFSLKDRFNNLSADLNTYEHEAIDAIDLSWIESAFSTFLQAAHTYNASLDAIANDRGVTAGIRQLLLQEPVEPELVVSPPAHHEG